MSKQCACGAFTREVPVTPPGDARPAFPHDIDLVNRIFSDHFGSLLIPPGHLALLNKVPDTDRMEEIVVGGGIAGSIRYIPEKKAWEPIPRPEAGILLKPLKRFVVVSEGASASIRDNGASVLAPGLVSIEESVSAGDEVLILTEGGACLGAGRAKTDARTAKGMKHGQIVRTRRNIRSEIKPGAATWDDAVRANERVLDRAETLGIQFIRNVCEMNHLPVNVSFSGGKDSLATLLLTLKAIGQVPVLFADTGLEFPETYDCIERTCEMYQLDTIRTSGEKEFWETFTREGPPAVDYRWCCGVCKLSPVKKAIDKTWEECLSLIGQRKYESAKRAGSRQVWRNSKVPAQLSAAPIHHWTAMHVWLYIFREKGPFNPLYAQGLDRIGCFMCPSSDIAHLEQIRVRYPDLWDSWSRKLEEWRKEQGLSPGWITGYHWRKRDTGFIKAENRVIERGSVTTDEENSNC